MVKAVLYFSITIRTLKSTDSTHPFTRPSEEDPVFVVSGMIRIIGITNYNIPIKALFVPMRGDWACRYVSDF